MDTLTQTSLDALLLKATSSQSQNIDGAAVEAFCTLINKEKDGAHYGVKALANRLHAGVEREVLQTLNILDLCMSRCGTQFQSEVGKFRFLNEMIKLVSPKYLGSHTPLTVRQKVLQLMYLWTLDYPKETKIKEAYDMLRKQGVIREIPNPNISMEAILSKRKQKRCIFQDEEKSKVLQKLLQSKDPEDIQAANWLIKSMVKEDDNRAALQSEGISLLESVQNNIKLFNEMLDFYRPGMTSADELDIIRELYQSCQRMRPSVHNLASDHMQTDDVLRTVLQVSDDLTKVFNKYNRVVIQEKVEEPQRNKSDMSQSLLDFDSDNCSSVNGGASNVHNLKAESAKSDMDVLSDIFTSNIPVATEVLQPTTVLQCDKKEGEKEKVNNKMKVLEELDVLSEHLLKENLQSTTRNRTFTKHPEKIPMNLLSKQSELKGNPVNNALDKSVNSESLNNLDLNFLLNKPKDEPKMNNLSQEMPSDDYLVDIGDEKLLESSSEETSDTSTGNSDKKDSDEAKDTSATNQVSQEKDGLAEHKGKQEIKLNDIFVKLDSIKPSGVPPLTILDEKNGISITLHYAKDKPKEGVHVYVVTTVSKNSLPLSNYLFQAVIPKGCKLKLQTPSSTDLPAFNPFLPPSAITQIMLVGNPDNVQISLKFIVSYVMDDETITEMGEVESLPVV